MNDYEKSFVLQMGRLKNAGISFEALAREALTGKFGGAADVLLRDLSPVALREPEQFVAELSKVFGRGALGVYEPITRYVDMGLYSPNENSPILALLHQLGPSLVGEPDAKRIFLHEHRIKDEEGNYPDNAN
ncbi:MAG TPA: hypothetical protein VEB87_00495 [Nitrososphaerales archaeon]|nr:hypothetical protein [Nitrososphaerales archaeon]